MIRWAGFGCLVATAVAIYFIETFQTIVHFRLYTFGLIFLFFAVASAVFPRISSLTMVLASLAFGVAIIEAVAVAKEPRPLPPDTVNAPGYHMLVPGMGWDNGMAGTYHSHSVFQWTGHLVFDVDYTIDAHHDRQTISTDAGRAVVFLGDSLTFGQGVEDSDTLPQRFADLLDRKRKTLNLAVDGYSPAQVLYELQTGYRDEVIGKNPLVFVMVTGAFHAVRTSCREDYTTTAPRYVERDGRLVYVGDCLQGFGLAVHRFLEQTASYRMFVQPRLPRETREDVKVYIDIVAEIARLAKQKYGVDVVVPYTGGPVDQPKSLHDRQVGVVPDLGADLRGTGFDDASIIAALRARGVDAVDMTLRDEAMNGKVIAIPFNNHPTPFTNLVRAGRVLAQIQSLGIAIAKSTAPEPAHYSNGDRR